MADPLDPTARNQALIDRCSAAVVQSGAGCEGYPEWAAEAVLRLLAAEGRLIEPGDLQGSVGVVVEQLRAAKAELASRSLPEPTTSITDGYVSVDWPDGATHARCSRELIEHLVAEMNQWRPAARAAADKIHGQQAKIDRLSRHNDELQVKVGGLQALVLKALDLAGKAGGDLIEIARIRRAAGLS